MVRIDGNGVAQHTCCGGVWIALMGLAIVSALMDDVAITRSCRDELSGRDYVIWEMDADRRLGVRVCRPRQWSIDKAAYAASGVADDAKVRGQLYLHLPSLELVAASTHRATLSAHET